jgi:DinB family protein
MTFAERIVLEYDDEMKKARTMLERVPDDTLAWKPHAKSMSLGQLANHVADFPNWAMTCVQVDTLDIPADFKPVPPKSTAEILQKFDKDLAGARQALGGLKEEQLGRKMDPEVRRSGDLLHAPSRCVAPHGDESHGSSPRAARRLFASAGCGSARHVRTVGRRNAAGGVREPSKFGTTSRGETFAFQSRQNFPALTSAQKPLYGQAIRDRAWRTIPYRGCVL